MEVHEQQKRSRKILSPELQAELEKKQGQAQGAGEPEERVGSDKPGGGRRPKLKFPARKMLEEIMEGSAFHNFLNGDSPPLR